MSKVIRLSEGGIWEEKELEIILDYRDIDSRNACKHVTNNTLGAVVVAFNEGGYASTAVCLECILDEVHSNDQLQKFRK